MNKDLENFLIKIRQPLEKIPPRLVEVSSNETTDGGSVEPAGDTSEEAATASAHGGCSSRATTPVEGDGGSVARTKIIAEEAAMTSGRKCLE